MARLRRQRDGELALLATESVVGRLATSHLFLDASFVSAAHALIRWNGEAWDVRDLGSTNGTYLDAARIATGASVRLKVGDVLMFGQPGETWQVVDLQGPSALAIPEGGGEPSFLASGTIPIPTAQEPIATIYAEGDRWFLEVDAAKQPIQPGERFVVAGREWRFECPADAITTRAAETKRKNLAEVKLAFEVSSDEEHVTLRLESQDANRNLGQRAFFYLALVLLRERFRQQRAAIPEPGWVEIDSILKMVPDYSCYAHLNVAIFRLRRALYDAGIHDAGRIIERRRGQIRLGTERAEVLRFDGSPAAIARTA
jgi:pSer/pThr/pTyr-binding forkhead associated (FHA) protein